MMVAYRIGAFPVLLLAATTLGGCDDFMRAIGKEKVVPDEFAVVSRAPLAVPPDFALRPPRIGASRPQEVAPVDQARETVFRAGDQQSANLPPAADQRSSGETELLKSAGAANAPKDIRQLVETDATDQNQMSDTFVDKLAFWRKDQKLGPTDSVIDPNAEELRLEAQKTAKAGTSGASAFEKPPTIEKTNAGSSSSGWFSWLF
jgi:hypothetical protein